MKKTLLFATIAVLSFPIVASAHPNLSQFPITSPRPVVTVPTDTVSSGGSFGGTGSGCAMFVDGHLSWCYFEAQRVIAMLANLR